MEAIGIEVPSIEVLNMGEIGAEQLQLQQLALIAGLLVAHVLGDFYFQPAGWVKSRNTKHLLSPALYLHALLHGVLAFFALLILSLFENWQAMFHCFRWEGRGVSLWIAYNRSVVFLFCVCLLFL